MPVYRRPSYVLNSLYETPGSLVSFFFVAIARSLFRCDRSDPLRLVVRHRNERPDRHAGRRRLNGEAITLVAVRRMDPESVVDDQRRALNRDAHRHCRWIQCEYALSDQHRWRLRGAELRLRLFKGSDANHWSIAGQRVDAKRDSKIRICWNVEELELVFTKCRRCDDRDLRFVIGRRLTLVEDAKTEHRLRQLIRSNAVEEPCRSRRDGSQRYRRVRRDRAEAALRNRAGVEIGNGRQRIVRIVEDG